MLIKKKVFKKLQKIRIVRGLEKEFGLSDEDLQKYLDNWESKMPESYNAGYSSNIPSP
jgi:hypothetical protein